MNRLSSLLLVLLTTIGSAVAQAPAAAVTTADSPDLAAFQKVEDAWSAAVNSRDQYGMELVLSPLLVDVSAAGEITTRNQQVAQLVAGEDKTLHYEQRVITVRRLGDIVVLNGTYTIRHKAATGPVDEHGVFTHVFERARGNWLCLNSQRTAVREEAPPKAKKQAAGESSFHVPLFSKGKN